MRTNDEDLKISVNEYGVMLENASEASQVSWNNIAYINYIKVQDNVPESSPNVPQSEPAKTNKKPVNFRDL
jgi:hypothetical protein